MAASAVGLGLGVLAAVGSEPCSRRSAHAAVRAARLGARTVVVAIAGRRRRDGGLGDRPGPPRRADPPVAALVDNQDEPGEWPRRRVVAGSVIAVGGVMVVLAGLTVPAILLVGLGAMASVHR